MHSTCEALPPSRSACMHLLSLHTHTHVSVSPGAQGMCWERGGVCGGGDEGVCESRSPTQLAPGTCRVSTCLCTLNRATTCRATCRVQHAMPLCLQVPATSRAAASSPGARPLPAPPSSLSSLHCCGADTGVPGPQQPSSGGPMCAGGGGEGGEGGGGEGCGLGQEGGAAAATGSPVRGSALLHQPRMPADR